MKRFFAACPAALLIAGCAATRDPVFYLTPAPQAAAGSALAGRTVALRGLNLPLYARAVQIAALAPDGSVTLDDNHRWADDPARGLTRALAAALRAGTGAAVVVEPWPDAAAPNIRLDVNVDRFIGALGGASQLRGDFRLVAVKTGATLTSEAFDIVAPSAGAGYQALVDAHAAALARLAEQIPAAAYDLGA